MFKKPSYPKPDNEAKRLEALRRYNLLDTPAEQSFDDFACLASYNRLFASRYRMTMMTISLSFSFDFFTGENPPFRPNVFPLGEPVAVD